MSAGLGVVFAENAKPDGRAIAPFSPGQHGTQERQTLGRRARDTSSWGSHCVAVNGASRGDGWLGGFEFAPAAGSVVGDDLLEHGAKGAGLDLVTLVEGDRPGGLVVVPARDDPLGIGDDRSVVEE
jgi:hypothetical protein